MVDFFYVSCEPRTSTQTRTDLSRAADVNDNNDDNNDDDVDVDDDESGDEKLRLGAEVQQGRSAQVQAEDERPAPQEPQRHRAGRAAEPAGNVLPTGGRFKN